MTDERPTESLSIPLRPVAEAVAARLHVVHPPACVTVHALPAAHPLCIGRSSGAGICTIEHGTVSRRHLQIVWDPSRQCHAATDLGSHNGSWLNGMAVPSSTPLADGAVIRLGGVVLVYERGTLPGAGGEIAREAVPGEGRAVRWLRDAMGRAAGDPSPVLVLGETGTGKEFVARALHDLAGRAGAFVPINCATLTAQLAEAQLFGVRERAVTAVEAQAGAFREAEQGTLLLDEIGELPLALQPKLLRAIQEQEVTPLGASRPVRVDVRVVAATHRDLEMLVAEGAFRRDLHARLSPWVLHVPPLRERRADLMAWIERLSARWFSRRRRQGASPVFSPMAVERLLLAEWPDNLRGVERLIHRLADRGAEPITAAELGDLAPSLGALPAATSSPPADAEGVLPPGTRPTAEELAAVLARTGSVRAAARALGRDRKQIHRWMQLYGLR